MMDVVAGLVSFVAECLPVICEGVILLVEWMLGLVDSVHFAVEIVKGMRLMRRAGGGKKKEARPGDTPLEMVLKEQFARKKRTG